MTATTLYGWLTGCAGLIPFLAFSWAIKGHFRHKGRMALRMRIVTTFSLFGFGWFGWRMLHGPVFASWPFSIVLFAASFGIFAWAILTTRNYPPALAFDDVTPSILYRGGPYRYVRHPFYLGYIMFWIGTAVATPALLPWAVPIVMILLYAGAARSEERKFAKSELAKAYAAYRAQAGMFLPRVSALLPE